MVCLPNRRDLLQRRLASIEKTRKLAEFNEGCAAESSFVPLDQLTIYREKGNINAGVDEVGKCVCIIGTLKSMPKPN